MKRIVFLILIGLLCFNLFGKLAETKKINVNLPKFGVYESETFEKFDGLMKRVESDSRLEGKSIWGKLLSGFFPKGNEATIYDLNEKLIYQLDLDKKQYYVQPIEKIFDDDQFGDYDEDVEDEDMDEEGEEEPAFKILRQEFKITNTKKDEEINQFKARHYIIHYLLEKMNLETKKITTDSLYVDVYTTNDTEIFEKSAAEKEDFNVAMMNAVGIELGKEDYQEMMGVNWLKTLQAVDEENQTSEMEIDYDEFDKIKGYPVLVDGEFYVREIEPKKKEKKKGFGGLSGLKKNLMKKAEDAVLKKDNSQYKMVLGYKTETVSIAFDGVTDADFTVPSDFEEK